MRRPDWLASLSRLRPARQGRRTAREANTLFAFLKEARRTATSNAAGWYSGGRQQAACVRGAAYSGGLGGRSALAGGFVSYTSSEADAGLRARARSAGREPPRAGAKRRAPPGARACGARGRPEAARFRATPPSLAKARVVSHLAPAGVPAAVAGGRRPCTRGTGCAMCRGRWRSPRRLRSSACMRRPLSRCLGTRGTPTPAGRFRVSETARYSVMRLRRTSASTRDCDDAGCVKTK